MPEFQKFNKNARHLRRLQRETIQSIEDVGLSGNLSDGKLKRGRKERDLITLSVSVCVCVCFTPIYFMVIYV